MGFYSDLEETKKKWTKASLPKKMVLFIFLFLAISSVTSIAEVVFKWKGFILDGVIFYQEWIRSPIVQALSFLNIPQKVVDIIIATSFAISVMWKSEISPVLSMTRLIIKAILSVIIWLIVIYLAVTFIPTKYPLIILISGLIILGFTFTLSPNGRREYFYIIGSIFIFVLFLAAINSGLSRAS